MTERPKQALGGITGTLNEALNQSARDLETRAPVKGQDRRMTLAIVAGAFFLLGFLWARARAQAF